MSASTHKSSTGVSNYAYENFEQVLSFNLWDAYPRLRPPKPSPCKLIESLEKRVKCKETSLSSLLTDRIMKRTAELKMIDDTKVKRLLLKKLVDLYHAVAQLPYEFASQKERKECETRLTRIFTLFEDKMLHLIDIIKPPRPTIKVPCPIFRNGLDINKILREQVAPPLKSLKLVSDSNEKIQFIIDTPRDDVSLLWRKAKSLKEIIGKALAAAKSADIPRRYFEIIQESLGLIEFCICEEASVPSNYRKDISYLIELLEKDHPFDLELILHIKILKIRSIKCVEETDAKYTLQMDALEATVRNISHSDKTLRSTPHAYWLSKQYAHLKTYPQPDDDLKLLTFLADEKRRVERETLLKEYEDKHLAFERRDLNAERAKRTNCLRRKIESIKRKLIEEDRKKFFEPETSPRAMPTCPNCRETQMKNKECCDKRCCDTAGTVYRTPAESIGCSRLTRHMNLTDSNFICHASLPTVEPPATVDDMKNEPAKPKTRLNFDKENKISTAIHYLELDAAMEKLFRRMSKRKVKQIAQERAIEERRIRLQSDSGIYDKERWKKWMQELQGTVAMKK